MSRIIQFNKRTVTTQARTKTKKVMHPACPRCSSPMMPSPLTPDWSFCAQPGCRNFPPIMTDMLQLKEFVARDE